MKWREHKEKWRDCQLCELAECRGRVVLARGSVPCEVLFVGEAPGPSEDVLGQPFMGPAGKLLDSILKHTDLKWALTNLVACFPKEIGKSGWHEPSKESIEACAPRLREFVGMCKPRVIVCVGGLAEMWAPRVLWKRYKGEFRNMIHPAAILRMDISQRSLAMKRCIEIVESLRRE